MKLQGPSLCLRLVLLPVCLAFTAAAALLAAPTASRQDAARNISIVATVLPVRGGTARRLPAAPSNDQRRAAASFAAAINYAAQTDSDALLVWQSDRLVLARNFAPYTMESRAWSASMAKTLVAMMVGIAIHDRVITSVDQPVATFFPEWSDDDHRKIRFRDLMEMSSGLHHPAGDSEAGKALMRSDNIIAATLSLAVVDPPGTRFDYNTANVTLLMEALSRAVRRPFADYLSDKLWRPLGASDASLATDRTGHAIPALFATAGDWMRVGVLIERHGRWNGRQLVPAAWIEGMVAPSPRNRNYGWLVWLGSPPETKRSYGPKVAFQAFHSAPFDATDVIYLDGFGGQRVYVIPSRRTVIVRTGGTRSDWDDAVLPNAII